MPFFDPTSLYQLLTALGVSTSGLLGSGGYPTSAGASPVAGGPSAGAAAPVSSTGASASGSASSNPAAVASPPAPAGMQDLTSAEMAGPVPRALGGSGLTPLHIAVLQALGFITPDGNVNTLGILSAALQGASAIKSSGRGDGGFGPQAPAFHPGGGGIQIPQVI
jgi:hypothetical protein